MASLFAAAEHAAEEEASKHVFFSPKNEKKDDEAVENVLESLGSALGGIKVPQYNPLKQRMSRTHHYRPEVIRRANTRATYKVCKCAEHMLDEYVHTPAHIHPPWISPCT
jgi:hypothetical protein